MEKYTMFMDWKNQHCQNGHTTQSNLQLNILIWLLLGFFWEKELPFKPVFFEFLLNTDWDNLNILILAGAYVTSVMSNSL